MGGLEQLYATIGIHGSSAAQQLLGKAKSLKSVGGLAQFVREFMLDEPTSIAGISDALEQIDPLVEARELLDVSRRKRTILDNVMLGAEIQGRADACTVHDAARRDHDARRGDGDAPPVRQLHAHPGRRRAVRPRRDHAQHADLRAHRLVLAEPERDRAVVDGARRGGGRHGRRQPGGTS